MIKSTTPLLFLFAILVLAACSSAPAPEQQTPIDSISLATSDPVEEPIGDLPEYSDTITYIGESENEDNILALFVTKKQDTLSMVLPVNQFLDESNKNHAFAAVWEVRTVTSGGDATYKYEQAYLKKYNRID